MTWFKSDTRKHCGPRITSIDRRHPKARAMAAHLVWDAVLGVNAEHACDGTIEPLYAAPEYLNTFVPLLDVDEVQMALADLELAGLLEQPPAEGGIGIRICGWDEEWRATKSSTARVRLHRARHKAQERRSKMGPSGTVDHKPRREHA